MIYIFIVFAYLRTYLCFAALDKYVGDPSLPGEDRVQINSLFKFILSQREPQRIRIGIPEGE